MGYDWKFSLILLRTCTKLPKTPCARGVHVTTKKVQATGQGVHVTTKKVQGPGQAPARLHGPGLQKATTCPPHVVALASKKPLRARRM